MKGFIGGFLTALFLGSLLAVFIPAFRTKTRMVFQSSEHKVLSTLKKDFFQDGRIITFAKVKTPDGLYVEVYETSKEGVQKNIDRILLPDTNDGFFHFHGQATNLALEDIDGDHQFEVLAPTYDANQVAHLNIYKYNLSTKKFEVYLP